jgi:hypothetical protein
MARFWLCPPLRKRDQPGLNEFQAVEEAGDLLPGAQVQGYPGV